MARGWVWIWPAMTETPPGPASDAAAAPPPPLPCWRRRSAVRRLVRAAPRQPAGRAVLRRPAALCRARPAPGGRTGGRAEGPWGPRSAAGVHARPRGDVAGRDPLPAAVARPGPAGCGRRRGVGHRGRGQRPRGRAHAGGERRDLGGRGSRGGGCARRRWVRPAAGSDGRGRTPCRGSDHAAAARPVAELGPRRPGPGLAAAGLRPLGPAPDRRRDRSAHPRGGPSCPRPAAGAGRLGAAARGGPRGLRGAELPLGAGS